MIEKLICTVDIRQRPAIRDCTSRSARCWDSAVKRSASSPERPIVLPSRMPETESDSSTSELMSASRPCFLEVIFVRSLPTRRVSHTKNGSSARLIAARRQSSRTIATIVARTVVTLETIDGAVDVTTVWTPPMSLAMRDCTSPVRVRVKNASDSRCRWRYAAARRSCMTFCPTTLDSQVCATLRTPVTIAMAIIPTTSTVRSSRSWSGIAVSRIPLRRNGETIPRPAETTISSRTAARRPLYGLKSEAIRRPLRCCTTSRLVVPVAPVRAVGPVRVVLTRRVVRRRREGQRRVAVEEARRLQLEPDVAHRHDRPVLRPDDVVGAERVPDDDVLADDLLVGRDVRRQALATGVLVGVLAGGEALLRVVLRDPEVRLREARARAVARLLAEHRRGVVARHELERGRHAPRRRLVGALDLPEPGLRLVDRPDRLGLGLEHLGHGLPGVARRVGRAHRLGDRVDLDDGVQRAVDRHVHPHAEEVLMVRRVQAGADDRAVLGRLTDVVGTHREHAGELDLVLDRAVVVEVPEVPVLVVADGDDRRDDEPTQPPHLHLLRAEVGVLPRDACVLLVHADRVLDRDGVAVLIVDDAVEVLDVPDAVASERQRVRQPPDAVLALVEHVLDPVRGRRIAVRHVHLRQAGAVDDRPQGAAVVVADLVQDETLARREADAQVPLLPLHVVPVDREAGALGLRDLDRPGGGGGRL